MGGRVAEELIFHQLTTGASNDIQVATDLARKMVCDWGMSDKLGPLHFGKREGEVFLGRDFGDAGKEYSEQTAVEIDGEVRTIVTANYDRARKMVVRQPRQAQGAGRGAARVRDRRRRRDRHHLRGRPAGPKPSMSPRDGRAVGRGGRAAKAAEKPPRPSIFAPRRGPTSALVARSKALDAPDGTGRPASAVADCRVEIGACAV